MKGQRVGYEEWESVGKEDNRRGFEVLEGQIRWLMRRIAELENDRKREEDWKMVWAWWLSGMDRGIWLGSKGRNERERRKEKGRKAQGMGEFGLRTAKMAGMCLRRKGFASWWRKLEDRKEGQESLRRRGGTRGLRQKETKEARSGDGMATIGGTRWNIRRQLIPGGGGGSLDW